MYVVKDPLSFFLQETEYYSLCYRVGPCCLSVLFLVVYMC